MQKNEIRTGIVASMGCGGEGIVKDEGIVVFVPFAVTGEKVRYKVLKVTKKCAFGKLIEVLTPAEERVRPACPVFGKCGGCNLSHIRYQNQLKLKEQNVKDCFRKIAGINVEVKSTVKGDCEFRYRNKLQLPVGSVDGKTVIGFYAAGSHRIVPVSDCLINADWTKQIIEAFNEYVEKFNIKGFDEHNFTGELREIAVKDVKGNLIITVVTLSDTLRGENDLIEILSKKIKLPFSVYHNVNKNESNAIYGEKFRLLYGKKDYSADMLGVKYKVGVQSFMQVNASVCSKLYSAVREEAALTPETTVIDAYSGAGLMTALLAKSAKKTVGIEIVPEAVDCANALAFENGLSDKITNYLGKCEEIMPDIIEKERKNSSDICLILDPPRKGCDIKVIDAITKTLPEKIIYVSCMPSTLARDAGLITGTLTLNDKGEIVKTDKIPSDLRYEIVLVKPFDMFAQTKHIETLVLFRKKS